MSRVVVPVYRIAMFLLVIVALAVQFADSSQLANFSSVNFFSYFTNLSNIFGACVFLYCAVRRDRTPMVDLVRGAAVVYLTVTGIVYNTLLLDADELGVLVPWVNNVIHRVMPLVVIIDWLVDPPRTRLTLNRTLWWLAFPLVYVSYSLIRGPLVDWYPYPFLDPDKVGGYGGVAAYSVGIALAVVLFIIGVMWVGNKLGQRRAVSVPVE